MTYDGMSRTCEEEEDVISPVSSVDFADELDNEKEENEDETCGAKSGGGRRSLSWGIVDQVRRLVTRSKSRTEAIMSAAKSGGRDGSGDSPRKRRTGLKLASNSVSDDADQEDNAEDHANNNFSVSSQVPENLNGQDVPPAVSSILRCRRRKDSGCRRTSSSSSLGIRCLRRSLGDGNILQEEAFSNLSVESVVGSGILKKEDGFSDLRRRRMSLATSPDLAEDDMQALMQRRVSFNHIHNVRLFQAADGEQKEFDIEESSEGEEEEEQEGANKSSNMSLIPTFVFPRNTPGYRDVVLASAVTLESVSPSEDLNLVGCVRVNAGLLRETRSEEARARGSRVVVGVTYSKDGWETRSEVNAMMVRKRAPEAIEDLDTFCFRFAIDCSDMCLGQILQFSVWCADKNNDGKNKIMLHEDDCSKQFYSVRVANRISNNQWAEFAMRELANFAPPVKYNNRIQ